MSAASRDKLGAPPVAVGPMAEALRAKHRRSRGDAPEDEPGDVREGAAEGEAGGEPGGGGEPGDAPERARTREGGTGPAPEAPETPPEARTAHRGGDAARKTPTEALEGAEGRADGTGGGFDAGLSVLWELDQATRSYLAGLKKIAPRAARLASAVAAYLDAGGSAADIRSRFAAIGVPAKDVPAEVQEALKRPRGS